MVSSFTTFLNKGKYVQNTFQLKNTNLSKFSFMRKENEITQLIILKLMTHFMFDLKNICVIQKIIKMIKNECFKFNFQNIYPH